MTPEHTRTHIHAHTHRMYEWTGTIQRRSRLDCADAQVDLDLRYSNAIRAHHYTR